MHRQSEPIGDNPPPQITHRKCAKHVHTNGPYKGREYSSFSTHLRAFAVHFPPNFHHGPEKKTGSRIRRYISGCTFFNPMSVQAPYSPRRALQQSKQLKLVPFPNVEVNSDVMMSDAEPMYPDVSHSRLQSNASSISSNTSDSPVTQSRM